MKKAKKRVTTQKTTPISYKKNTHKRFLHSSNASIKVWVISTSAASAHIVSANGPMAH